ncbi:hypothetical protein CPLU01_02779 [Colletotrichum plurivorum]|uniref:RNase P and RNase MRP subunit n=1 Tax=Colletotrichum plurivorum TaxID=2175906 RepID=A0A8H6KVG6_9PEZI|nr:hypothetical protein CPLU01_02779 [Colletotrichum plurivorum]
MAASMRKKLVYSVDTPYSAAQWPDISFEDQDTILELLCSLLAPLGQHRQRHVTPSEGKRAAKRKRKDEGIASKTAEQDSRPPTPELASFVDVGLASITRNLEKLAAQDSEKQPDESKLSADPVTPYTVIFVARSGQSSAFNCQLPQMVAVASNSTPPVSATRLVGYSKSCADRLSASLGIPRVSAVGVRVGAPMSKAFTEFVQSHVSPVRIAWLDEAPTVIYRPTQLKIEEKMAPGKKLGKA